MSNSLLAALALAAVPAVSTAADPADTYPDLHLIPWPKSLQVAEGHLLLTGNSRVVASQEQLRPLAEIVSGEIAELTGLKLQATTGEPRAGDIVLRIDETIRAGEPILVLRVREPARTTDGAHAIAIDQQAVVTGFDYRATAEGSSTLLQLLGTTEGGARLPRLQIHDWPHADYCGVMLDVARQDHPIAAVKQVVQLCRLYKARYLQLHLTDDQGWTFPSSRYPELGSKNIAAHGGVAPRVYTREELKELVAYADARGITIVPELEMPGHCGAAVRSLPEVFDAIDPVSKRPVGLGCMNLSSEALYPALDTLIGEMCDVFRSSPYFHIGSDEVTTGRLSLNTGYREFLVRHGLKDDGELADYFVREMCALVKKHGKKAIKWEGLANYATRDVILMCWENSSNVAAEAQARGYTTITCPWQLGVPWEEWSMYCCNASRLKKGNSVLGATLVAWEQSPGFHTNSLRNLAHRQERTWGPDNRVTVAGIAARFPPLDAVAGKLLRIPVKPQLNAEFSTSLGTRDFLEPAFAFDGNDATFYQSEAVPNDGDHFTLKLPEPRLVHALEVLTGVNGRGRLDGGEVQLSADGREFTTVAKLVQGAARAGAQGRRVRAVRLLARSQQREPLVVRAINLGLLVEVAGAVRDPGAAIGTGNVAAITGDTEYLDLGGRCSIPIIDRGFTLKLKIGGKPCVHGGPISGSGIVEIEAGGPEAVLTFDGEAPNTLEGTWLIKGRVVLAKPPGVTALGGTIVVSGDGPGSGLSWGADRQLGAGARVELHGSSQGSSTLDLNGFHDTLARLVLAAGAKVRTGGPRGGVLTAKELWVDGKRLASGVYTSAEPWVQGQGYVVVGDVRTADVSGVVEDPNRVVGAGNIARLTAATTLRLPHGDCSVNLASGDFPLTLIAEGKVRWSGMFAGGGSLRIEAGADHQPFEFAGPHTNSYAGPTTLARGVLKLSKPRGAMAVPGDLMLGGSAADNNGDGVLWGADGQMPPTAVVTLQGAQPSFLNLDGHKAEVGKVSLSPAGRIRTGKGGTLHVKQLFVDGKRLSDGSYTAPQSWLEGTGTVTVDARVDVHGLISTPDVQIGMGNVANLTGPTKVAYPASGLAQDVLNNGFTLTLDSGDGNAFSCTGSIAGTGDVEFFMGPSHTGFKDAPLMLGGERPNTASGKYLLKKGRVQLQKPKGVAAISGDVIVGGQGFNDCLFWKQDDQLADGVHITLLDAGVSGAAYLALNGHSDRAAGLTMTARNKVRTDAPDGASGVLSVKTLAIDGVKMPAGEYTAATERWIEGRGKVVVLVKD
jgi:hexosaminidase